MLIPKSPLPEGSLKLGRKLASEKPGLDDCCGPAMAVAESGMEITWLVILVGSTPPNVFAVWAQAGDASSSPTPAPASQIRMRMFPPPPVCRRGRLARRPTRARAVRNRPDFPSEEGGG